MPRQPLLAILGPTASGKTDLSIALAHGYRGEIISADSRQMYVGIDIGTNKIARRPTYTNLATQRHTPIDADGIPHYLIDIFKPTETYSVAEFCADATVIIQNIHRRNHLPMIVGGTGHYIRALTEGQQLSSVPPDSAFRQWANAQPLEALVIELQGCMPDVARSIDLRNPRRIIRALEIARAGGSPSSAVIKPPYRILKLALHIPLAELKERIIARTDEQLAAGLIEEVRGLVQRYGEDAPGLKSIGTQEVFPYLHGNATLEETRNAILRANWQYARRQHTWLKKEPHVHWIQSREEAQHSVQHFLHDS